MDTCEAYDIELEDCYLSVFSNELLLDSARPTDQCQDIKPINNFALDKTFKYHPRPRAWGGLHYWAPLFTSVSCVLYYTYDIGCTTSIMMQQHGNNRCRIVARQPED